MARGMTRERMREKERERAARSRVKKGRRRSGDEGREATVDGFHPIPKFRVEKRECDPTDHK